MKEKAWKKQKTKKNETGISKNKIGKTKNGIGNNAFEGSLRKNLQRFYTGNSQKKKAATPPF